MSACNVPKIQENLAGFYGRFALAVYACECLIVTRSPPAETPASGAPIITHAMAIFFASLRAGAFTYDARNNFSQPVAWRRPGRLQARQPRDPDDHDLFGLCPAASGRREAPGGLVSLGTDLHSCQR